MELKIQNFVRIFFILTALITITLADCTICKCRRREGLETIICQDRLSNFPKFKTSTQKIEIYDQKIPTLSNGFFKNLQSLQILYMRDNEIENIAEDTFFKTLNITELDLSQNQIIDLKVRTFQHLPKIRILELNDNQIKLIQNGLFRNLLVLEELHLENNYISVIEENAFGNNFQLNYLNLGYNLLKRLNIYLGKDLNSLPDLLLEANLWTCNCENKNLITNFLTEDDSICTEPDTLYHKPYFFSLTEDDFNCNTFIEIKQNFVIVHEHNLTVINCELLYTNSNKEWQPNSNFLIMNTKLDKTEEIRLPIEFYQIYQCYLDSNKSDKVIILMMDTNLSILNVHKIIQLIYKETDKKLFCDLYYKPDLRYDKETIIIDYKSEHESEYSLILRRVNSQDTDVFKCGGNNFETRKSETNTEQKQKKLRNNKWLQEQKKIWNKRLQKQKKLLLW